MMADEEYDIVELNEVGVSSWAVARDTHACVRACC